MAPNKALIFKQVPDGVPQVGRDLTVETREFDLEQAPPPGGITTENLWMSLDPYMRGRMRAPNTKSYSMPFTLDAPCDNYGLARVLKSDHADLKPGDVFSGFVPGEQYSAWTVDRLQHPAKVAQKLENPFKLDPVAYLNVLGMPGLTAYSSLYDIGQPRKGETIFISSAAGAVGLLAGQLAKHEGLRVIGSVGDDEKLQFIRDSGFDDGFNYKKEKAADALARLCPKGIDIYFENVGGEQLDAALEAMNDFGRIIACGMISQYSARPDERYGVKNLGLVVSRRLTMRGFIVNDQNMGPRYEKEHHEKVGQWTADGTLKQRLHVSDLDHAAEGLVGMLQGANRGKAVVKLN